MLIEVFPSGPFSTNAYAIACETTREAAIIDPAPESSHVIQSFLSHHQLNAKKILLTHSHWDHIADVQELKEKYQIPIYIHSLDAPNLQKPGSDGLPCWVQIKPAQPDVFVSEGMEISLGNLKLYVIHTPGHSPGSVCYYIPQHHTLLSGDTLFQGTIGNLSFPTSQPSMMWSSLDKIAQLPPQTQVYPGHGPSTTIAEESSWLSQVKNLFDK